MGGWFSSAGRDAASEARKGMEVVAADTRRGIETASLNMVYATQTASMGMAAFGSQMRQGTEAVGVSIRHASSAHERSVYALGRSVERAVDSAGDNLLLASREATLRLEATAAQAGKDHINAVDVFGKHAENAAAETRRGCAHIESGLQETGKGLSTAGSELRVGMQDFGESAVLAAAEVSTGHQKAAESARNGLQHLAVHLHSSVFVISVAACFFAICAVAVAAMYADLKNVELVSSKILYPVFAAALFAFVFWYTHVPSEPPKFHNVDQAREELSFYKQHGKL